MATKELTGGPTEIRSTREITAFRVRHLTDEEYEFHPAVVIDGPMGAVYVTPGQLVPLVRALTEMMEEVL